MIGHAPAANIVLTGPNRVLTHSLLAGSFAIAAIAIIAVRPDVRPRLYEIPQILCSSSNEATSRPKSQVSTLRSEPITGMPGKRVTVQLVRYPPNGFTPSHVHGGDVTAVVLKGTVRSEHAGLAAADYQAGEAFHEPIGTTHVFIENTSMTEPAEILAITVHDEGAQLTTLL